MALLCPGVIAVSAQRWASRALSSQRVAMLIDGDQARVSCVCVVNGIPAGFQIDCGSTFTQIAPELAPQRVPRHGLGSASCLGRRLWFPTCEVELAPVDREGHIVHIGTADEPLATRVQIGSSNLLGLFELRRWRVDLSFGPEANHCSMRPPPREQPPIASSTRVDAADTVLLTDAIRAASALNEGTVAPEEARCSHHPWLVDASKVIAALRRREDEKVTAPSWWSSFSLPCDALIADRATVGLARVPRLGLSPALPLTADVLFGTADALVSHSEIPPLLAPPPVSHSEIPPLLPLLPLLS